MAAAIALIAVTAVAYVGVFYFRGTRARLTAPILRPRGCVGRLPDGGHRGGALAGHLRDALLGGRGSYGGDVHRRYGAHPRAAAADGIAAIAALTMLVSTRMSSRQQSVAPVDLGGGLWLVGALLAGLLWPSLVQRFSVQPNELERERPYIERSIAWTREGFDLARVSERTYDVADDRLAADIAANPATISNIRLWDPRPLLDVYNQIQHLRLYYSFLDPDIDRYYVDGEYRQVLLGRAS